jgi:hypothetical protein
MALSLKWVTYACRMAGAARPRWSRELATWTTSTRGAGGELETLTIRAPAPNMVRIDTDSDAAHRIVTSLFTGMRWAERQKRAA